MSVGLQCAIVRFRVLRMNVVHVAARVAKKTTRKAAHSFPVAFPVSVALRQAVTLALCLALLPAPAAGAETPDAPSAARASAADAGDPAKLQGQGDSAILDWVLANSGPFKGETLAGDLRVAYTITTAEGWWEKAAGGKLAWHEAPSNQVHLRVFVADRADGRLVPAFSVMAALIDANGNEQALPVSFGWYPLINAYGGNIALTDGSYRLRVRIAVLAPREAQLALTDEQLARGEGVGSMAIAEFPAATFRQNDLMLRPPATEISAAAEAELLKPCNDALRASITALWQQSASGEEKSDGNYFVAYALEAAPSARMAALRRKRSREFVGNENARVNVLVRDSRTGRPIPFLALRSSLETPGELHDQRPLVPMRHPWFHLYGRFLHLQRKTSYRLRVTLEAPDFRRWGRQSERFALPAEVVFENVALKPENPEAPKPEASKPEASKPEEHGAEKPKPASGTHS